jgi:hypothetical protein
MSGTVENFFSGETTMTKFNLVLFFSGILCVPGVYARPKGFTDKLIDQADVIVVGETQTAQENGRNYKLTLAVVRSIKGSLNTGQVVTVSGDQRMDFKINQPAPVSVHLYGIWFLKQDGASSNFKLLPVKEVHNALTASGFYATSRNASPGLIHTSITPNDLGEQIALELGGALVSYTDVDQLQLLAYGLMRIYSPIVPEIYRTLRSSSDIELKIIGLAGLLGKPENVSVLQEVAANVFAFGKAHTNSVPGICGERDPDPRAIAALGKIAFTASNIYLARCAAEALQYIHTKDTLTYLNTLLDSQDATTREYAIRGFSRFVDNLPIPNGANEIDGTATIPQGPAPYKTAETDKYSISTSRLNPANEAPYLQFWKGWWATVGKLIN